MNLLLHSQPLLLLSMPRLLLHLDQLPIVHLLQFMLRFHPLPCQLVFAALQLSELVGVVALALTLLLLPLRHSCSCASKLASCIKLLSQFGVFLAAWHSSPQPKGQKFEKGNVQLLPVSFSVLSAWIALIAFTKESHPSGAPLSTVCTMSPTRSTTSQIFGSFVITCID